MSLGVCYFTYVPQPNSHFAFAYSDSIERSSSESEKKARYIVADSYRKKVFFKYEKRIRTQSPPENDGFLVNKEREKCIVTYVDWFGRAE